ncbi:MAG: right-handed parallel beta-helix repeat-containing protein [Trueperaceae bacterium]|nr:right-handed parallel beta-helix repeat-containing protein [Trueperaceae bacterium]
MRHKTTQIFILLLALSFPGFAQELISSSQELIEAAQQGGVYQLAPGSYGLSEPLTISRDFTLIGEDTPRTGFKTKIRSTAPLVSLDITGNITVQLEGFSLEYLGETGADVIDIEDANFELRNLEIVGGVYSEPEAEGGIFYGSGLYLYGTARGKVENCVFRENEQDAIHMEGEAEVSVKDSSFSDNDGAIALFDSTKASLEGIEVSRSSLSALYAEADASMTIINSRFQQNTEGSAYLLGNAQLSIRDSQFEEEGELYSAITVGENARLELFNSQFQNNLQGSVWLFDTAEGHLEASSFSSSGNEGIAAVVFSNETHVTFIGNTLKDNEGGAISLFDNAQLDAKQNSFEANGNWTAVYLGGSSQSNFSNNQFLNNLGSGVFLLESATASLSSNQFDGNGDSGLIAADQSQPRLTVNRFSNNVNFGVHLYGNAVAYLAGNHFENNTDSGLMSQEEAFVSAYENNFGPHNIAGMVFFDSSSGIVRNNKLTANTTAAVIVANNANPKLETNQVSESDYGLLYLDLARGSAQDNQISNTQVGIYKVKGSSPQLGENSFEANDTDLLEDANPPF